MKRRRWRRWVVFVLVSVPVVLVVLRHAPTWTGAALAARLSRFFHRPASVGAVRFQWGPFRAEIEDLRVGGAAPGRPPFLELPRAVLVPSLATIFQPDLVLSEVRLERPRIRILAYVEGSDDIPSMGGGGGGGLAVSIDRLVIVDGEFDLDHQRVPLNLDLPDFHGQLRGTAGRVLRGSVHFGPGPLQFGTHPWLPVGTEIELELDGPQLTVNAAHLRARDTDIVYHGQLNFTGKPHGEFQLDGPVSLDVLDTHVMRTGFGIKGAGHFTGTVKVDGSRLRLAGRLRGTQGEFDKVSVSSYDGHISWDERGVILEDLKLETLDGTGVLGLTVPPRPAPATLNADFSGIDAERLIAAVFDIGLPGVDSAASGRVEIEWPRGDIRHLSGSITADLTPRGDARTPLRGPFRWHAEQGVQFIDLAQFHTPATGLRLSGRIEVDDRANLEVQAESRNLEASDGLARRVRLALGNQDAALAGLGGQGVFRGSWRDTLQEPLFEGRASVRGARYMGVTWGDAEWAGAVSPHEVRSHSLVVRRPGGELWLDGSMETGDYGLDDALDLDVRLARWPARDLIQAFEWDLELEGLISGQARMMGRRSRLLGRADITAAEGTYYGIPFTRLATLSQLDGSFIQLSSGRARVGGGVVRFGGTATLDGVYDGRAEFDQVDIEPLLPPLAPDTPWHGPLSGGLTFKGTLARPRAAGQLTSSKVSVGDETLGTLVAHLRGAGDGHVAVVASCESARVSLAVDANVEALTPYATSLTLQVRDTRLDPFLRLLAPRLPPDFRLTVGGRLSVAGPANRPRALRLEATVPKLELGLPDYSLRNSVPLRFEMEDGHMVLRRSGLEGEGTHLELEGRAALLEDGPVALQVNGVADLRALSSVRSQLRGRGQARLRVDVTGTRDMLAVDGQVELVDVGVRMRGFPHGVEGLTGDIIFSEKSLSFADLRGNLGGGELTLEGHAAYGPQGLGTFEILASGRGMTLRYPEGLRSQLDADLRLFGDAGQRWVTGEVRVNQALWSRRYEVASELLAGTPTREVSPGLEQGLRYDIKVKIPGTMRIDNNLASMHASAELNLQGTATNPVIVGHAQVDRGRIYFQGNTYVIQRGTIDFVNPEQTDPQFDIEAETRIRSYRVTLKVGGTLERVYPTLTSDPPLSAVQILNLLAGADESTVASLTLSQTDQAKLAAAGAATLAAGRISEEVGLERGAERLLGLNRFSIDPSIVKGGVSNPTARLTVGKRLTPDLNVQYSIDLRGTEERILSVEMTLSNRLSFLLTRNEPGGMGFDLRLRRTY